MVKWWNRVLWVGDKLFFFSTRNEILWKNGDTIGRCSYTTTHYYLTWVSCQYLSSARAPHVPFQLQTPIIRLVPHFHRLNPVTRRREEPVQYPPRTYREATTHRLRQCLSSFSALHEPPISPIPPLHFLPQNPKTSLSHPSPTYAPALQNEGPGAVFVRCALRSSPPSPPLCNYHCLRHHRFQADKCNHSRWCWKSELVYLSGS